MKAIRVTIEGTTPLLCNRFTDEAALKATAGSSAIVVSGSKGTPREQAEKKLYTDDAGQFVIPQPNVFSCIIAAGTFFKAGKSKVTTAKSSLIPTEVAVRGLAFPITHRDPWSVDSRPVRNPATGGRFLCYRPRFDDWRLTFEFEIDEGVITLPLMREIVDAAGKKIGLGDFRPSCKGPFGKFVVAEWKPL